VPLRLAAILGRMAIGFPVPGRPLRADAQRNRERLLEAGRALFAERGLDVTMDEIAHCAGVGVGTAYRRFGSRDELIGALFEARMEEYVAIAEDALREPDAWRALVGFLERSLAMQAADRGLKDLLFSHGHALDRVERVRGRVLPLVERMVDRAREAGTLRPDVGGRDIPLISLMLANVVDFSGEADPELWRRYLALVLDGLSTSRPAPSPLPGEPLPQAALDAAMARWGPRRH
jgi:AcrR family transcriptional regulator